MTDARCEMGDERWELGDERDKTCEMRDERQEIRDAKWRAARRGARDITVDAPPAMGSNATRYPTVVQGNQPLWRGAAEEVTRLEAPASQMVI